MNSQQSYSFLYVFLHFIFWGYVICNVLNRYFALDHTCIFRFCLTVFASSLAVTLVTYAGLASSIFQSKHLLFLSVYFCHIKVPFLSIININNIYYLQLSCHPVAVVILHVYRIWNWLLINLSWGGYMRSM